MQDAYPRRPKALHFINMPSVMESVFKMAQGFQKEKMRARNHVHPVGDYRYFRIFNQIWHKYIFTENKQILTLVDLEPPKYFLTNSEFKNLL